MSKPYLVTTRERDLATLAFCEFDECYCSVEAAEAHEHEGHTITWLRQEVA